MSGLRMVDGVKAVDMGGLWQKVTEDGRRWREGIDDWYLSSTPAESILKAIAREESLIIVKSGFLPEDAKKPAARTDTAADRIKALFLASDTPYTARDLSEQCNCSRCVADESIDGLSKAKVIVQGKDTRTKNKGRPARSWVRKQSG